MGRLGLTLALLAVSLVAERAAADTEAEPRFRVTGARGEVAVRPRGALQYRRAKKGELLPEGSLVRLSRTLFSGEPTALVVDARGATARISGETVVRLGNGLFAMTAEARGSLAIEKAGVPMAATEKALSPMRRVLRFLTGSAPTGGTLGRPKEEARRRRIESITPIYPPAVKVIETATLPIAVDFEWPVLPGQTEPHALHLWPADGLSLAPVATARGGRAEVAVAAYGTYAWQVVDGSERFASPVRSLVVRKPVPRQFTLAADDGSKKPVDLIELLAPSPFLTLVHCDPGPEVRLEFRLGGPALERGPTLRLDLRPTLREGPPPPVTTRREGTVTVASFGLPPSYKGDLRVYGFANAGDRVPLASTAPVSVEIERECDRTKAVQRLAQRLASGTFAQDGDYVLLDR